MAAGHMRKIVTGHVTSCYAPSFQPTSLDQLFASKGNQSRSMASLSTNNDRQCHVKMLADTGEKLVIYVYGVR